jgi:hypothetical protein
VAVLGGFSTILASYLAKVRGSGEPEFSSIRSRELSSFLRELHAFIVDDGSFLFISRGGGSVFYHLLNSFALCRGEAWNTIQRNNSDVQGTVRDDYQDRRRGFGFWPVFATAIRRFVVSCSEYPSSCTRCERSPGCVAGAVWTGCPCYGRETADVEEREGDRWDCLNLP